MQRVASLKLYLIESQGFNLNFKDFNIKSIVQAKGHKALSDKQVKEVKKLAKLHSIETFIFITLLLDMAARAQDLVGLTYGKIKNALVHKTKGGTIYEVKLDPKKTNSRVSYVTEATRN